MTRFISTGTKRFRAGAALASVFALGLLGATLALAAGSAAGPTTVRLGGADSFAVLAHTAVTDVPTSSITGNVGLSPTTGAGITGLTCAEVHGRIYSVDAAGPLPCRSINPGRLTTAKSDLDTAYGDAAGRTPTPWVNSGLGDNQLGGQTLTPGVYRFGHATTANLTGSLTLKGSLTSVWIFQATSDLVFASSSSVHFIGGAQACNVFWQVGSSATVGTSASIAGTIMALTSITVDHAATIKGRVLARTGAVTLDNNTIVRPGCAVPAPTPTTAEAVTTTTTAAATTTTPAPATTTTAPPVTTTVTPAPTPKPPAHKTKAVKAAKHTHVVHVAPMPVKHAGGFTG